MKNFKVTFLDSDHPSFIRAEDESGVIDYLKMNDYALWLLDDIEQIDDPGLDITTQVVYDPHSGFNLSAAGQRFIPDWHQLILPSYLLQQAAEYYNYKDFKSIGSRHELRKVYLKAEELRDTQRRFQPDNWPVEAPRYLSPQGWEFEKDAAYNYYKSLLTASWFRKQGTAKHLIVANRLDEILCEKQFILKF